MSPSTDLRENREFARELKFQVPRPVAEKIHEWASERLEPDPHAELEESDAYLITSLYFDTPEFDVYRRNGSYGRSKYRIRRYGPSEIAFLERKLKTRGLVTKRRAAVHVDELARLTLADADYSWKGNWYHQRLLARRLKPVCQIKYRRTARVSMTGFGPIRLTLDHDIQAVAVKGLRFENHDGLRLSEDRVVVELKYRADMPALFKNMMDEFGLDAQPVSKYRLAVVALGFASTQLAGAHGNGVANAALLAD